MDYTVTAQTGPSKPARILIACVHCKTRKIRCDGGTPSCANCAARSAECSYAPVRKLRGPGKNKRNAENSSAEILGGQQPRDEDNADNPVAPPAAGLEASSQIQPRSGSRAPVFVNFLLPDVYSRNVKALRKNIRDAVSAGRFAPLLPQFIARPMIENTFADIMAEHKLLDLSTFMDLLDAQYAASLIDPAGNPARWAVVNAVMALASRFKIAPGSEAALCEVPNAFFRNATTVVPELVLRRPSVLSVRALLAMAMFARSDPDTHAFIMLVTNASRHVELLCLRSAGQDTEMDDEEQYMQLRKITSEFETVSAWNAASHLLDGSSK